MASYKHSARRSLRLRLLVLPIKLASPAYWALIVRVPWRSEKVLTLAAPPANVTGEPSGTPSVRNCTVPTGVPLPGETAVNVEVNVTFEPVGPHSQHDVRLVIDRKHEQQAGCLACVATPVALESLRPFPPWTRREDGVSRAPGQVRSERGLQAGDHGRERH